MRPWAIVASLLVAVAIARVSAGDPLGTSPRVGEVRGFAIGRPNVVAVADMHRDGWIEARGQLVSVEAFPELYCVVGREWTARDVPDSQFALPEVRDDRFQRAIDANNAYRALGPGDLITGGRTIKSSRRLHPISYWIFAGRSVSGPVDAPSPTR